MIVCDVCESIVQDKYDVCPVCHNKLNKSHKINMVEHDGKYDKDETKDVSKDISPFFTNVSALTLDEFNN